MRIYSHFASLDGTRKRAQDLILLTRETAMRSTQQLSITLPIDMANILKEKVAAVTYASESEVIRDGIRALLARDRANEAWLAQSVATTHDATLANPARSVTPTTIRERLAAEHNKVIKD